MFNKTIINQQHDRMVPYEKTVNITEKRAPTDESIRLLNEMTAKAKENIVATLHVDENFLKATVIFYKADMLLDIKYQFGLKFVLNGRDYTVFGTIEENEWQKMYWDGSIHHREFVVLFLIGEYSKAIATELIKQQPVQAAAILNQKP